MPRLPARLLFALVISWSVSVRAEADAVSIEWQSEGVPACTKPNGAEAEVVRLAGARAHAPTRFRVACQALDDGRYRCAVRVDELDGGSERVLSSCDEAREAAVLIMAMALAPAAPAPASADTLPAPAAPAASKPRSGAGPRDTHWTLSLAALVDYRTLPRTSFGPALGVGFAARLFRVGLAARYLAPRSVSDLPPGVTAELDWISGALSTSLVWRLGAWGVGPRAELELGALRGRASGVEERAPASAFWVAASAGAELELWLHARVGVQLLALVGVPLQRPQFGFADDTPFYTAAPAFVRGTLGLTFRIDSD